MKISLLRAALFSVALGAALSAHAAGIDLFSAGTNYKSFANTFDNETVTSQQGGLGKLTDLYYNYAPFGFPFPEKGNGYCTGPGGQLNFSLSFTQETVGGGLDEYVGTWTATGGTGGYANAVGSGTITTDVGAYVPTTDFRIHYATNTTLRGTIQAVPEPSELAAALGLGAAAFMKRRKWA